MNEKKEKKCFKKDEDVELSIEEITEVQGGIEKDETDDKSCGLGCFIGAGPEPVD